ncbi:MAG TPA: hypothetical protein VJT73_00115 [Polyangiaceae bacterium]|nr:hypothetical protein [Polyangiaceae bacterium]
MEPSEIRKYATWVVAGLFLFALYSEAFYRRRNAPARTFNEGQDTDVSITLVSTDAKALACASAEELKDHHCEYESKTQRWSKPAGNNDILAPYKTTDDALILVAGLFNDPALRQRLVIDPPVFGTEHIRFVANCKMHVDGKLKSVDVRWATNGQWQSNADVPVGVVKDCFLSDG